MTERERWVVYPLLFLALGAALRDKLVDRTITKSIVCQELTVVDEEPLGHQTARVLARIGRTEPKTGGAAGATMMINGHVAISGAVIVDGVINAKQYAYQDIPFMPLLQVLPGAAIPDWWRTLQQPGQSRQNPNAPDAHSRGKQLPAQPPATEPKNSQNPAPSSPAEGEPDATK